MGLLDNIKKEAQGNRTKIQTPDASQLDRILGKLFFLPKKSKEETEFIRQVITRGFESQERVGLHASSVLKGEKDYCVRQQVLSLIYKQSQDENINVALKRIYEEGNAIHEKWQRMFLRAGFSRVDQLDYTQYNEEYMMYYTPDIICNIPEFHKGDMVCEIKSMNTFQFQKAVKHPSAWKQCQWYMHLTGLKKGFVLDEDKNCQDVKIEIYEYDAALVAPFIERAEEVMFYYKRVLEEKKMPCRPRDATSCTCKRCEECHTKEACWNVGMGRVRIDNDEGDWG